MKLDESGTFIAQTVKLQQHKIGSQSQHLYNRRGVVGGRRKAIGGTYSAYFVIIR